MVDARTRELVEAARAELAVVLEMGGAVAAVENAYMKQRLVESQTERRRAIEDGEQTVVGVNAYTESEPSPLLEGGARAILTVDESAEHEQVERLRAFRARRSQPEVTAALRNLRDVVSAGGNVMPPSIRCAHAGVTTGEWSDALRALFGEYRAPTGVSVRRAQSSGERSAALSASGFSRNGSRLRDGIVEFSIVIPSTSLLDAARIDTRDVMLGDEATAFRPLAARRMDVTGDGLLDLVVSFDPAWVGHVRERSGRHALVGLHFDVGPDIEDYWVPDIFDLGSPLGVQERKVFRQR